jgi:hypothetical protein
MLCLIIPGTARRIWLDLLRDSHLGVFSSPSSIPSTNYSLYNAELARLLTIVLTSTVNPSTRNNEFCKNALAGPIAIKSSLLPWK